MKLHPPNSFHRNQNPDTKAEAGQNQALHTSCSSGKQPELDQTGSHIL